MDLLSCFQKLYRSRELAHTLVDSIAAHRKKRLYEFVLFDNADDPGDPFVGYLWKLKVLNPAPDDWALILGDIVSNIRASLDHAIYAVVTSRTDVRDEAFLRSIQFPITSRNADFRSATRRFQEHLSADEFQVIRESQPWVSKEPGLKLLQLLSNSDKHRTLTVATFGLYGATLECDAPNFKPVDLANKRIIDGMTIGRARFRRPANPDPININLRLEHSEAIELSPGAPVIPIPLLIERIYEEAFDACTLLTDALHTDWDRLAIVAEIDSRDESRGKLNTIFGFDAAEQADETGATETGVSNETPVQN